MIGSLVRLGLWIHAAFLLAWNLLRFWPGERIWAVAFVNYFTVWFMLSLVPLAALALLKGDKPLAMASCIAFVLMGFFFIPVCEPDNPEEVLVVSEFDVMTYNVHKRNTSPDGVIDVIRAEDADIIALQEITPMIARSIVTSLASTYPYNTLQDGQVVEGQGLLSKFPIIASSPVPDYRYQRVKIDSPMGYITLLNVHTPTLFPIGWREDWEEQRTFFRQLANEIGLITGPLLVVGDFNTTPMSENYAILNQALADAFSDSGSGLGLTYPAGTKLGIRFPWPLVRIDYIFYSNHFAPLNAYVVRRRGGSDHFPMSVRFGFVREEVLADHLFPSEAGAEGLRLHPPQQAEEECLIKSTRIC